MAEDEKLLKMDRVYCTTSIFVSWDDFMTHDRNLYPEPPDMEQNWQLVTTNVFTHALGRISDITQGDRTVVFIWTWFCYI